MNLLDKKRAIATIKKYHTPGCGNYIRRAKNAIFISRHNSIRHELGKCLGAIMVSRFGDLKFNQFIIDALIDIEYQVNSFGFTHNHHDFISEAVPNDRKERRVDLVDLVNSDEIEFETSKAISKKDCVTIRI